MHIPGHIAVALAQHCLPPLARNQRSLRPLLLASLFPDLVDKTIGYVFQLMPNGRHYAHNIFSLVGISLLVGLVWGRSVGYAWFVGYLGHLIADTDSMVPWFFPLQSYHLKPRRFHFAFISFAQELLFLAVAVTIYRLGR